jgi:kynureninase
MSEKMNFQTGSAFASECDRSDHLASFRDRFFIPVTSDGKEVIYFTGNSLGLQPRRTGEYVQTELADWARYAVDGHLNARNPWLTYHELLTEPMARIIGANASETVMMNSLTVNLHLMLVSFYRPDGKRRKIVIEKGAFPSDRYAIESQIKCRGLDPNECLIEVNPRSGENNIRHEDIESVIGTHNDEIALVMFGGVNYYTGQAFDIARITKAAHAVGAIAGFDLAHSAGNIDLYLSDSDADFAVWCSYKYLNGGPGGIGGVFVHSRHSESFDICRFAGWWGHDKKTRFLMKPEFKPLKGAEGWQISNPPILQMAALRASLEIFDDAGMHSLRQKSLRLTGYLEFLINGIADERIEIITPSNPQERGCQLSIRVKNADRSLFHEITRCGVFADWREPDVIRVAPVPLYNSYNDVYQFAEILRESLAKM